MPHYGPTESHRVDALRGERNHDAWGVAKQRLEREAP